MDLHSFYLLDLDPDPHSEKMMDQDTDLQKMNADPQPWLPGPGNTLPSFSQNKISYLAIFGSKLGLKT